MADRLTKSTDVVSAATAVFLRYGLARTTMGDLATEARISRPALYLLFSSKEDLFAAVVRRIDADWHAKVGAALRDQPTVAAKLRYACEKWAAHGIDVITAHPDAKDLFDVRFAAVREMYDHFVTLIADLIKDAVATSGIAATPAELARSLVYAMRGIKDAASNTADMRRLAKVQVTMLVAALGLPPTPAAGKSRRQPAQARRAR